MRGQYFFQLILALLIVIKVRIHYFLRFSAEVHIVIDIDSIGSMRDIYTSINSRGSKTSRLKLRKIN